MYNKDELRFVRDTQEAYNQFTVEAVGKKLDEFRDDFQEAQIKLSFDYHIAAVESSYTALKRLTVNTAEIDEVKRALAADKNPTGFSVVKRIPDINEIKIIHPDFILYYLDMMKNGVKAVANGTMSEEKKKKVMTYKKVVNSDTMKNIVIGSPNFYRLNFEGDIKLLAQVDNAVQTTVNVDYLNYVVIPYIARFPDTIKEINKLIVQYRGVMDAIQYQYDEINSYYRSEMRAHDDNYTRRILSTFFLNCTQCLFQIITFVTYMIMRKVNTIQSLNTCYDEIGKEYVDYVNRLYPASRAIALPITEDTVVGSEAPLYDNGTQFLEGNTTEIHRIAENILNFYRNYEPYTRVERLFTADKDPARTLIDPYRGKKEMLYATYDTATLRGADIFNDIDQELEMFEQNMSDPYSLPSEIVMKSGLTVNFTEEYKDILRDIVSVDKYSSSSVNYSRSLIFMVFKEVMDFEKNLRQAMLCAQKTYNHMTDIHGRLLKNDNMEFQSDRNRADLATFMNNLLDSYKAFCGKVYGVYVDRLNKLNSIMDAMHTDVESDHDAYYSMMEAMDCYNPEADLDMIDFKEAIEESEKDTQEKIAKLVVEAKKLIYSRERGDLFLEAEEGEGKPDDTDSGQEQSEEDRKKEEEARAKAEQDKKDAEEEAKKKKELEEQENKNKDESNEEDEDGKKDSGDDEEEDDAIKGENDKKAEGLFARFLKWVLEFFNKLKDKQTPTAEESQRIQNYTTSEILEFVTGPDARLGSRPLENFTIHGFVGKTSLGDDAKGVSSDTIRSDIERFLLRSEDGKEVFRQLATAVDAAGKAADLEIEFVKIIWKNLGNGGELFEPANQNLSAREILVESLYKHYAYGGLDKARGANIKITGQGEEKREFFSKEVIPYMKKYANSEIPGWIPSKSDAQNLHDKLFQGYIDTNIDIGKMYYKKNNKGKDSDIKIAAKGAEKKEIENKMNIFYRSLQDYLDLLLLTFSTFSKILSARTASYATLLENIKKLYDKTKEKKESSDTDKDTPEDIPKDNTDNNGDTSEDNKDNKS